MAERWFTIEEAQAALEEVRPLAEELVERNGALRAAMQRQSEITTRIAGNGGGLPPQALADVQQTAAKEAAALSRCLERIQVLGVQVMDLERGLVDFPAVIDGREVYLCWLLDEPTVTHWHGIEAGFAGRRPLH